MKYKAVIFDVSDTLIEYQPNYAKIYIGIFSANTTSKMLAIALLCLRFFSLS